jgi:Protein of unknown function (DUF3617)
MKFTYALSLSLVAILFPLLATAQTIPLLPGEYEVTATVTFSNVQEKAKPDTNTRCIKVEDLANVEAVFNNRFMAGFKADASCKVSGLAIGNGKISYSSDCKYSSVRVEGTLSNNSFSVVRTAKAKASGGVDVSTKLQARRIGACK